MRSRKESRRSNTPSSYAASGTNSSSEVDARFTKRRKLASSSITSLSPFHSLQSASSSCVVEDAEVSPIALRIPPFCMISNASTEDENLQTCHVIPLDIPHDELSKLQFSWGLRHGELSLDSPANTIILTSQLYHAFRSGAWALIPVDNHVIDRLDCVYLESPRWRELQYDKERMSKVYRGVSEFEYVFFPFRQGGADNLSFRRRKENMFNTSAADVYTTHSFPFDTLPRFRSHLHPHFALYDFIKKTHKFDMADVFLFIQPYYEKLRLQMGNMNQVVMAGILVYNSWLQVQLPPHYTDDNPPVDGDDDTTSLAGLLGPNDSSSIRSGGTGESEDEKESWDLLIGHPLRDRVKTWQLDVLPLEKSDDTSSAVEASAGPLKATASVEQMSMTN